MMMGPPGQSEMDTRMSALSSWRKRAPEPETDDPMKVIYPLLAAQFLDALSTEQGIRGYGMHEENPIPLAGSTLGRLGLTALEAVLLKKMVEHAPKVGKAVVNAKTRLHTSAAQSNWKNIDEEREGRMMKRMRGER